MTASDGAEADRFGVSVSIRDNYAILGAIGDGDNGVNSGSAYIFNFDGANWLEQQKLLASDGAAEDLFGISVSIDGTYAIVGANDDDNGDSSGSAYIFHFDGIDWIEQQKLLASDGLAGNEFGISVSISGNYSIVGAPDEMGVGVGAAYIFYFDGFNWIEQSKLLASDGVAGDLFGISVSIDGTYAIVGSMYDDDNGDYSGSAYIFHFDGANWIEKQKLLASDGEEGDAFGISVSISGNDAIVGTHWDDDNGSQSGSAYIFRFNDSNWFEQQKVIASDGDVGDCFGISVSISGNYATVGAWGNSDFGAMSGSAYIFNFDGNNWVEQQKLLASDGDFAQSFGYSVSISGNSCIVGADNDDENGIFSGAAYIY